MKKTVNWCEELNSSDRWDFYATEFPKCPHCGFEHEDYNEHPYLFEEGKHEMHCESCGNEFTVNTFISFTFSTVEQEGVNGNN